MEFFYGDVPVLVVVNFFEDISNRFDLALRELCGNVSSHKFFELNDEMSTLANLENSISC